MPFIENGDELRFVGKDAVIVKERLPIGIYDYHFDDQKGPFVKKSEISLFDGRVYGNAGNVANHIVEKYEKDGTLKNKAVLLSGNKGLGKSLTIKLVIAALKDKNPIVIVRDPRAFDAFANILSNTVVVLDEFEKIFDINSSSQERLLSIIDGTSAASNNLFLLSVNNEHELDRNLISRPGRIQYHYKYKSVDASVIREYCNDNLKRKELTEDVVRILRCATFVSLDMISEFVKELNLFENASVEDVSTYINIDFWGTRHTITIKYHYPEDPGTEYISKTTEKVNIFDGFGFTFSTSPDDPNYEGEKERDDTFERITQLMPSKNTGSEKLEEPKIEKHPFRWTVSCGGIEGAIPAEGLEIIHQTDAGKFDRVIIDSIIIER